MCLKKQKTEIGEKNIKPQQNSSSIYHPGLIRMVLKSHFPLHVLEEGGGE